MIINFKGTRKVGVRMKAKTPHIFFRDPMLWYSQLLQFKLGEGGRAGLTAVYGAYSHSFFILMGSEKHCASGQRFVSDCFLPSVFWGVCCGL